MTVKTEMKMEVRQNQNYTAAYCSKEQTDRMKFGPTTSRSAP